MHKECPTPGTRNSARRGSSSRQHTQREAKSEVCMHLGEGVSRWRNKIVFVFPRFFLASHARSSRWHAGPPGCPARLGPRGGCAASLLCRWVQRARATDAHGTRTAWAIRALHPDPHARGGCLARSTCCGRRVMSAACGAGLGCGASRLFHGVTCVAGGCGPGPGLRGGQAAVRLFPVLVRQRAPGRSAVGRGDAS